MTVSKPHCAAAFFSVMLAAGLASAPVQAQTGGDTTLTEVDPIRCWWRSSAGSVRVGETFSVILTCAVIDGEDVQVVPDQAALDGAVVPLAPFEVVRTAHPPDLRSGPRRFFQYDYTVQIINPDVIGRDVPLPELPIHYRINSRVPGTNAQQGRDLTYVMPPQSVRVVSTVPQSAPDIRDAPDARFAPLQDLSRRAGILEIVAITLMGLGGLMAVFALIGLVRALRGPRKAQDRTVGEAAIVGVALNDLKDVQREREQHGWTAPLVGRATAALRIVAATAAGRTVSQREAEPDVTAGEGRLIFRRIGRRGKAIAISSSVTAEDMVRELNRLPAAAPADRRQLLESLHAELALFAAAQYGLPAKLDEEGLDAALASAIAAAQRIRTERLSPTEYLRRWATRTPQPERQT